MTPTENLLIAVLRNCPSLPGARCRGRWDMFDNADCPETVRAALSLCSTCPALDPCRTWLDGLPKRRRPLGVTAGQVNR
jgi:hypothetical protein